MRRRSRSRTISSLHRARPRRRRVGVVAGLGVVALTAASAGAVGAIAVGAGIVHPTRSVASRVPADAAATTLLVGADGTALAATGEVHRLPVPGTAISPYLRDATVAIEDRRFYEHGALDLLGIARALLRNAIAGRVAEGASTLTQQLVTVRYLEKSTRSVGRKLDEAALASEAERGLEKDEILTGYLNAVYYGAGAYGAEAAALTYFGRRAADLSLAEAALLAGLPQAPSTLDPFLAPEKARARRDAVLDAMLAAHRPDGQPMITEAEWAAARGAGLGVLAQSGFPAEGESPASRAAVAEAVAGGVAPATLAAGGLRIETTVDLALAARADAALRAELPSVADPDGVLVAIRPATGEIVALSSSRDPQPAAPDIAVLAQPIGGLVKPIVAAAGAVAGRALPAPAAGGEAALARENAAYGALAQAVGLPEVTHMARVLGVRSSALSPTPSLAAGAQAATATELAAVVATLAAGGRYRRPHLVRAVRDPGGALVRATAVAPERAVSPAVARAVLGTFDVDHGRRARGGIAPGLGTAWRCAIARRLVACAWVAAPPGAVLGTDVEAVAALPARIVERFLAEPAAA